MRDPFGLPFENRFSRLLCCQFQILHVQLVSIGNRSQFNLPYAIAVVGNGKMILKLVERHLRRLASIVEERSRHVPRATTRNPFQRLGH